MKNLFILKKKIVGITTSSSYSFCFNKNLIFGYVEGKISKDQLQNEEIFVEVAKKMYLAELQTKSLNKNNFKTI